MSGYITLDGVGVPDFAAAADKIIGTPDIIYPYVKLVVGKDGVITKIDGTDRLPVDIQQTLYDLDLSGTQNRLAFGLLGAAAGGAQAIGGTSAFGLEMDLKRVPATSILTDDITVVRRLRTLMDGSVSVTVKPAKGVSSTSGNNTMVTAVSGKKIAYLGGLFMAAGTVSPKLQDGAGGTDLTPAYPLIANMGFEQTPTEWCWGVGSTNTLLNLNLNAAIAVAWHILYAEIA